MVVCIRVRFLVIRLYCWPVSQLVIGIPPAWPVIQMASSPFIKLLPVMLTPSELRSFNDTFSANVAGMGLQKLLAEKVTGPWFFSTNIEARTLPNDTCELAVMFWLSVSKWTP